MHIQRDDMNTILLSSSYITPVSATFLPSRYAIILNLSGAGRLPPDRFIYVGPAL
jgi:hypothetical protein